jgi:copper binding plastocyanin/azurin family protein
MHAEVNVQYSAYGPSQLDVLPGDAVTWSNVSSRTHTVTADDGSFDSGRLGPQQRFRLTFSKPGTYRYHCTIHPSIAGEIDVRRVTLATLPTAAVPVGTAVDFTGVTSHDGGAIRVERRVRGSSFTTVARTRATTAGSWRVELPAAVTGDYRAASGADASEVRRLIVGVRTVHIRQTRNGVDVAVTPSAPYARILVEVYRRERFGWWPAARRRLDYVSEAEIQVRAPARVRVVLVDRDGWTPLATSRAVTLRRR